MSEWYDVIIANIVFWPLYIFLCTLPARMFEYTIQNHEKLKNE